LPYELRVRETKELQKLADSAIPDSTLVIRMLVGRIFARRRPTTFLIIMSRHIYLDASPPPYTGARDYLDRNAFTKTITVVGARVRPEKTGVLLKAPELRK